MQRTAYSLSKPHIRGENLYHFVMAIQNPVDKSSLSNDEIQLHVETLAPEVKQSLQNIIFYGAKLWQERADTHIHWKSKIQKLDTKIDATQNFIREILSKEDLTAESIREAYETFERNDENRSSCFYRIHTFLRVSDIPIRMVIAA